MAGLTPAVTTPFGNSGQNMAVPVTPTPETPDFGGVEGIVTGSGKPATPIIDPNAAPPAEADPYAALAQELDPEYAALAQDLSGEASPAAADEMSPLPAPEGIASLKEQFGESVTRMKNAFAVTNPESLGVLKNSGLFDDVRDQNGTIQVKRKGRKGWENFDRDKFELVGDVLDFARDGVEALVEKGTQAAGVAAGVIAGAPTGPGAVPAGYAAGAAAGASGAVIAKSAGDYIAEKIGVPQDPNRNKAKETVVAAAFGGGFGLLGSAIARRTAARAAARAEATKTVEHAMEEVGKTIGDIKEVQASGIILGEGGRFRLDPQQMVGQGTIPELDVTAKQLSTEQSFRNFRREIGTSLQNAYDSVAKTLGAQAGKADIADDFVLTAADVKKAEGSAIGAFRDMARKAVGTQKLAAEKTGTIASDLLTRYGGAIEMVEKESTSGLVDKAGKALASGAMDVKIKPPSIQTILRENPALTETQARLFRQEIVAMNRKIAKGGGKMRIDDMEVLYNDLTRKINNSIDTPTGRAYAKSLIDLKNAVRDDWTTMIGTVLPESEQAAYGAAKVRYGQLVAATDQLGKMLETDNLTRNELVGKLFEGKGSYKFAQSAKTLIQETNPQLWDQLAGEYFVKLRNDATDATGKNVNWMGMAKKWRDLDPRLRQDLLNTTGIKPEAMQSLLNLGVRVQSTTFEAMPKQTQEAFFKRNLKNAFAWWGGGATAKGAAAGSLIEGMGKDQAVAKWLKDGGMEEILKEMPGLKPEKAAGLRNWIAKWTPTQMIETTTRNQGIGVLAPPEAPAGEE